MNEKNIYLLLDVIKRNASIRSLVYKGLKYTDVAKYLNYVIENSYVTDEDGVIDLTELGRKILLVLEKRHKEINKDVWIEPESENRIPMWDNNTIFIPSQDELEFEEE